jgi:glycosyltransferase involved in cell wall biosynthesis
MKCDANFPKLSIIVFCYNHANYVAKALDSVFEQQELPRTQLIIADDNSNDGTLDIIRSKIASLGNNAWDMEFLSRNVRLGMQASVLDAISRATGEYVAFLDGDDYWCDPGKLAMQLEVLAKRKDVYLCAHNSYLLADRLEEHEWRWKAWRTTFSSGDYLRKNLFHTSSIVMRNPNPLPNWMLSTMQLDFAVVLWGARRGPDGIAFIPRHMSVYRMHTGGISKSSTHRNMQASYDSYIRLLKEIQGAWPQNRKRLVEWRIREVQAMLGLSKVPSKLAALGYFLQHIHILWRPAVVKAMQWMSEK